MVESGDSTAESSSRNPAGPNEERADGRPRSEGGASGTGASRISVKEDWANLDEYGRLIKYISVYREPGQAAAEEEGGEYQQRRVWYAPWKKKRVRVTKVDTDGAQFPEDWLVTDIHHGLSAQEVMNRRRRAGWNELVSEKENPFAKVLTYFRGPILYGKEWHFYKRRFDARAFANFV